MFKRLTSALSGLLLGGLGVMVGTGSAATIAIDLVPSTRIGAAGSTLTFNGTLFNDSDVTVFLNSAAINVAGGFSPSDLDTLPFFLNAPFFLDAGESAAAIDLFKVRIANSLVEGPYLGQFTILGGSDEFALDIVGEARFTVQVASEIPEPGTFWLLAPACGLWILRSSVRSQAATGTFGSRRESKSRQVEEGVLESGSP